MKALSDIQQSELEAYVFPGTDAAILVAHEKVPQSELESSFGDLSGQHRFYPTDTGWKIKFPYWYVHEMFGGNESEMTSRDIIREERGWDHEHCSFCNDHSIIYATALRHSATLWTQDSHFQDIPSVRYFKK